MNATLIARMKDLSQYDPAKQTVTWNDPAPKRWKNLYSKLRVGNGAIFMKTKRGVLIGTVSKLVENKQVECENVDEYDLQTGDFLRLHEAYPELLSRIKAHTGPFIHPRKLGLGKLKAAAAKRDFVDYFVLRNDADYQKNRSLFRNNDRVLILKDGRFDPSRSTAPTA